MKIYKNMYIIKVFFISYTICLLGACRQSSTSLEDALVRSGDNRKELEKVLSFYSTEESDSLKLRAAIFLITNMPGHHFYDGELVRKFHDSARINRNISFFTKKTGDILLGQSALVKRTSLCIEDIKIITSGYLIQHIETSFKLRDKLPWLQETSFDTFLHYVLPYRVDKETLDYWRDSLFIPRRYLNSVLKNTNFPTLDSEKQLQDVFEQPGMNQDSVIHFLGENFVLGCLERSNFEVFKLRILGIPAAVDYLPFYANRNGFHGWVQRFLPEEKNIKHDFVDNRKGAKILRRTFAHNPTPTPAKGEKIPALFTDSFNKDVTNQYMETSDLTIETSRDNIFCPNHIYLAVFNELEWRPIWWAKNNNGKAIFNNMGRGIVYTPVYFTGDLMKHLSYPFILNNIGKVRELIPDTLSLQKFFLTRKYPKNSRICELAKSLRGIKIVAANNSTFIPADTICMIDSITNLEYFECNTKLRKKYRFIRVIGYNHEVAELLIKDENGERLKGDVKGNECIYPLNLFDDNPLSNTKIVGDLDIDFGKPVAIERVVVIPRGDGNGIYPKYQYELFYQDKDGWVSLGRKTATDVYLEYENVPSGALYWLRNRSTGEEERVFTFENGMVRFW